MLGSLKMRINDGIYGIFQKIYRPIYKIKNRKTAVYVPVLAFHWFLSEKEKSSEPYRDNRWYASVKNFEEQLRWLKQHGYYTLTNRQFYDWISGRIKLEGKPMLLTFDDGEMSQLNLVLPLLKKYGYQGICFVVGKHYAGDKEAVIPSEASEDDIANFTKEQFDETASSASVLEMESHTYNLHYLLNGTPAVRTVTDKDLRHDLDQMRQFSFESIAMPYGGYGRNTKSILKEYYKLGFDVDRVGNPYASRKSCLYSINRIQIDGRAKGDFLNRYLY